MKTFQIEVQEFLARVIDIKAKNIDDAISKIDDKYWKAEIVLNSNDFAEVNFIDINAVIEKDEKDMLITEVIDYLYKDEKKHFEEMDEPELQDHIYPKLEKLISLLDSRYIDILKRNHNID